MTDPKPAIGPSLTETTLDPRQPLSETDVTSSPERAVSVYEIGRRILGQKDPDQVLETLRDAVIQAFRPDVACLVALGEPRLRALFSHGIDTDQPLEDGPLSHTVLERVRESGLAVLSSDARGDARFKDAESVQAFRIRSVLCVPLGQPVRAAVYLHRRFSRSPFTPHDLAFLTALCVYAGLVMDRTEDLARTSEALLRSDARASALESEKGSDEIVGHSRPLLRALEELVRLAREQARVLLLGETGTGKELFARRYARECGRSIFPVAIPALSPSLVESELFGHARGAFSSAVRDKVGLLEAARDGVLFLDEVGDVEPALQVKLLRFLESGELRRVGETRLRRVNPLVVSGTNRALNAEVAAGRFRADLAGRLGHVVSIPPLRERKDDIPALVDHFARGCARGHKPKTFSDEALAVLQGYDWPLNVRELRQVVERAAYLVDEDTVGPEHLPDLAPRTAGSAIHRKESKEAVAPLRPLSVVIDEAKRQHILAALAHTKNNKAEAIRLLGLSTDTFYRWLKELGISEVSLPEKS